MFYKQKEQVLTCWLAQHMVLIDEEHALYLLYFVFLSITAILYFFPILCETKCQEIEMWFQIFCCRVMWAIYIQ